MTTQETTRAARPGQFLHVQRVLSHLDVTRTEMDSIIRSGMLPDLLEAVRRSGGIDRFRSHVRSALRLEPWPDPKVFQVKVKVCRTTYERMCNRGSFAITSKMPEGAPTGPEEETVWIDVFNYPKGKHQSHEHALEDLKARSRRPLKLEELLALGEQNPELQTHFPIVAVGCGDAFHNWMLDRGSSHLDAPQRRCIMIDKGNPLYDFYRVAGVFEPTLTRDVTICNGHTTAEAEVAEHLRDLELSTMAWGA